MTSILASRGASVIPSGAASHSCERPPDRADWFALRRRRAARLAVMLAALCCVCAARAAPSVAFASVAEARALLAERDAFVVRLGPLDRAARLGSSDPVSEKQYLDFVRQAPREWTPAERARVTAAYAGITEALSALLPPLDEPIRIVKSSGAEEGGAAYTRGGAVVLPESHLRRPSAVLERTLAHEVFHVVSRRVPELRRALYEAIGFRYCGEVALPQTLVDRKITNPDAPINDHCIRLRYGEDDAWFVPILLSRSTRDDSGAAPRLFESLSLELLAVDPSDGADAPQVRYRGAEPLTVPLDAVGGFYEQVGRNTSYVIHPEEILAENFVLLVLGETRVPSPDVLSRIRDRLLSFAR